MNIINMLNRYTLSLTGLIVIAGCSASQTDSSGTQILKTSTSETIDSQVTSKLVIEGGSLKGSEVTVPPGAVNDGSKITIVKGNTPTSFPETSSFPAASEPTAIRAEDSDGNSLSTLTQPMSISLPIQSTGLTLSVEQSKDNLCVFLDSTDDTQYVWRRFSLKILDQQVQFESTRFGTYQLVYCGTETLDQFTDATTADIAGTPNEPLGTITIPHSSLFNFSHSHFCIILSSENRILGLTEAKVNSTNSEQLIEIMGIDISDYDDSSIMDFHILFQTSQQECNGKSIQDPAASPKANAHFNFKKYAKDVKAGLKGTLGEVTESFGLKTVSVTFSASSTASAVDASACIRTSDGTDETGSIEILTTTSSQNTIGGSSEFTVPLIADHRSHRLDFFSQSSTCQGTKSGAEADTSSNQPTLTSFTNISANDKLSLILVDVSLTGVGEQGYTLLKRMCLNVYKTTQDSINTKEPLTSLLMDTKDSATYKALLPAQGDGTYILGYKALPLADQDCDSAEIEESFSEPEIIDSSLTISPKDHASLDLPSDLPAVDL